jgi:SM-20-related protein
MSTLSFLRRLGLFIVEDFLSAEDCSAYCAEIALAESTSAPLLKRHVETGINQARIDEESRRTLQAKVSKPMRQAIQERLILLQPQLEKHFQVLLESLESPVFYLYREGDFFGIHDDCNLDPDAPIEIQKRRVSTVIFLNDSCEIAASGGYGGGSLNFYRLIDQPQWENVGLPFVGSAGSLIAFPSDTLHAVKPVTHGERYTIANWFAIRDRP